MSKKSFSIILAAITAVCAFTFSGLTHSQGTKDQVIPGQFNTAVQLAAEPPEHVPYMFLFQHLKQLDKQAEKQRRLGKDGSGFQRRFKDALAIDDLQLEKINEIGRHCYSEVKELDSKAKAITEAFRAQYPPGIVPEGVVIPPPPAELIGLQEMRNAAFLRARDHMRLVLGEQEFTRFNENLKRRLMPGIKRISSAPDPKTANRIF